MNLKELMEKASQIPWQVVVDKHPHHLGGEHTERRIFTVANHPQLKSPDGVVNMSYGLGEKQGDGGRAMVALREADALLIIHCVNNFAQVVEQLEQCRTAFHHHGWDTCQLDGVLAAATNIPSGEKDVK